MQGPSAAAESHERANTDGSLKGHQDRESWYLHQNGPEVKSKKQHALGQITGEDIHRRTSHQFGADIFCPLKNLFIKQNLALATCSLTIIQPLAIAANPPAPSAIKPPANTKSSRSNSNPKPSKITPESFAIIEADYQGYDLPLGQYVAKGNVKVLFNGWLLRADRIEVADRSRSFYASGHVRLNKGDQFLQASSIRYSNWESTGEIKDVYGVIDQDTLQSTTKQNLKFEKEINQLPFACPELSEKSNQTINSILPPGRIKAPTMRSPIGCKKTTYAENSLSLRDALEQVVFQPKAFTSQRTTDIPSKKLESNTPEPSPDSGTTDIAQRVQNVRFQGSWVSQLNVNLNAVTGSNNQNDGSGRGFRPAKEKGKYISRIRFQASKITIKQNVWTANQIAITNDPFTPANAWTIVNNVSAINNPDGTTKLKSKSGLLLLDRKLALPVVIDTTLNQKQPITGAFDKQDRDGFYLGYNLDPIKIGNRGLLTLQPQFMLQRILSGSTNSFVLPGESLGQPNGKQSVDLGDAFGLLGTLNTAFGQASLTGNLSMATLNPDNIAAGTRAKTKFKQPLNLPGHDSSEIALFGGYRERIYNGSLGLQNLIYSYGAEASGNTKIEINRPGDSNNSTGASQKIAPYFDPIKINWKAQSGNYQADLYNTYTLATLWRSSVRAEASGTLSLWRGNSIANGNTSRGLRYSPSEVVPGLGINFGTSGQIAGYSNGSSQNTLTLWGGPVLTLGHFDKPLLDYTRLSASLSGTFINGLSPFGFDRAVDLRTLSFTATQQLYGPVVIEAGATYNIDSNSIFYGKASYSYLEVKVQRRSYEIGVFYSPYDGIGGIKIKLNDFNFNGSGTPFVPVEETSSALPIRKQ